jgi:Cys-Gly metallodipeptidase DUG1
MAPQLDGYFKQVDKLSESFIERLRKAVAIPSVSADDKRRPDVVKVSGLPIEHYCILIS